jgi:hypothetical protein
MVVEIFRVLDPVNIHGLLAFCRSARCHGSSKCRFLWSLDKFATRKFASFGLGRIAASYVEDLSRTHPIDLQFSTRKPIKGQRNPVREWKMHTSVRGCDLLKASVPKLLGTVDFFFKEVMAQTPSSISLPSTHRRRIESSPDGRCSPTYSGPEWRAARFGAR